MSFSIDGNGQKAYWEEIKKARQRHASNTKVGVLYIRAGETERQARKRINNAKSNPTPSPAPKSWIVTRPSAKTPIA